MKKFVEVSLATAGQLTAGEAQLRSAGFTIGAGRGRFANIDFDAKTVEYSNTAEGVRVWSIGDLNLAPATPVAEPVAEPVADNKAYVVSRYAGNTDEIEAIFKLNGWTVSGVRTMPNINFKPDSKEIVFASIASGERLFTKGAVLALLGDDYLTPEVEVEEVEEVAVEAEEILEPVEDIADDAPEAEADIDFPLGAFLNMLAPKAPAKYEHVINGSGNGYAVSIMTDGETEFAGDKDDFCVITK